MYISMRVVSAEHGRHFRSIPSDGLFLEPGEIAVMQADGDPVIISTSESHFLIAHTGNTSMVGTALHKLKERGVLPLRVRMSIQMYSPGRELAFINEAVQTGLRHVWAANPIDEFLARARIANEEKHCIVFLRRN